MVIPPLRLSNLGRDLSGYGGDDWPQRACQSSARDCAGGSRKHFSVLWCSVIEKETGVASIVASELDSGANITF